jgi:hypothetical protein
MKQLILTISPQMWQEYKDAVEKIQGKNLDDAFVERVAQMDMWQALRHSIDTINISHEKGRMDE